MLQHMLQAKDEVIVKLTNDMYELEKNNNDPNSSPAPSSPTIRKTVVFDTDTRELEKLRVSQPPQSYLRGRELNLKIKPWLNQCRKEILVNTEIWMNLEKENNL